MKFVQLFYLTGCLQEKTPKGKGDKAKTPPSPKEALTVPEIQAKMMEAVKKVSLPYETHNILIHNYNKLMGFT